jgi:hypothetical protein
MSIRKILVAALAATIVMAGPALAASIPIANFSFESPSQGPGGYTVGSVTDWIATGISGVFYPTLSVLPQGPTNGLQVGFSNGGSLSQTLSTVLTANTPYTLNVDLLNQTVAGQTNVSSTLELLAGGNVLARSIITGGTPGTNVLQTVSFLSGASGPYLGQPLGITLISGGSQSDWDNVRLVTTPVPEPSTYAMMLAGFGLIGFITYRRKNNSSNMLMAA